MKSVLRPTLDRVLVEPAEKTEQISGTGLYVVNSNPRLVRGLVLAVGPGRWDSGVIHSPAIEPGQSVLYHAHAGFKVDHLGQTLVLLAESDVLAVAE